MTAAQPGGGVVIDGSVCGPGDVVRLNDGTLCGHVGDTYGDRGKPWLVVWSPTRLPGPTWLSSDAVTASNPTMVAVACQPAAPPPPALLPGHVSASRAAVVARNAEIRAWAQRRGYREKLSNGLVPGGTLRAYYEAHPDQVPLRVDRGALEQGAAPVTGQEDQRNSRPAVPAAPAPHPPPRSDPPATATPAAAATDPRAGLCVVCGHRAGRHRAGFGCLVDDCLCVDFCTAQDANPPSPTRSGSP